MKKLMIALAAAATTMFSFGDVTLPTGTSFEALAEGPVDVGGVVNRDDSGDQSGSEFYWYSTAPATDELGAITNDVAGSGVSRPDMFANQNTKSLQIDTTAPLVRTALPNSGASNVSPVTIGTDGIYLDTLVKFTAADEAFAENLTGGDKIAIEYVEHEAEGDDVGYTNFVVRAGFIAGAQQIDQTNYFAAVPANFDKEAWHRLTVRTIADVGDGHVGFVIYLDGDIDKTLEYSTDVDAGFGTLNATAAKFYNNEKHALFPSAVAAEDIGGSTISSVAFSGSGFIDDVSFAAEAPQFIKAGEAVPVEITLGTGVTGVTVTIGETTYDPVDATATPLVFNLPAGTTTFVLGVDADIDNGYTTTGITASNDVSYVGSTITITGGSPALTVVGKRDNAYYMDGETKVGFATLTEAFASAPANATIKLGYNYSVADNETTSPILPVYTITKNLVLDLNGKTLDGGSSNARFLFSTDTDKTLTVIDSVSGDTGKIIYGGSYGIFGGNGDAYLGSNDLTDYGPVIDGAICGEQGWVSEVVRGKFTASDNTGTIDPETYQVTNPDGFVSEFMLAQGSSSELVSGYWVVSTGAQPPAPTQVAVPEAASNLVYDGTEQTGVAAGTGYTLSGDFKATNAGEYTATATPESGYAWVGGSTDATNITWSIAKASVTATVSLTVTEATYDSAKTAVTDYTTPSVNFGLGAPELVENTDYTVAWSATEVSGAGTFTYTVTPVAGSNYTFTETSATLTITAGGAYPTYIEDLVDAEAKAAYEKKYDDWKDTYGADTESAFGAAFLLNIAPGAADQTLEPVSITMEGGKVVISANQTLTAVNGKVYVKVATTLAGLATAEWTEATLDEGKVQVTPGSSDTAGFYKIKVDF